MNARNVLIKKKEFLTMLSAIALIVCLLSGCGSSAGTHADITRLDDEGYLYYMDYSKDYYGKDVMDAMRKVGFIDSGCSTFFTHNTDGAPITCRNYDYPHRVSKEDRSLTGVKARSASRCAACGLPERQHLPFRTRVHHLTQWGLVSRH